MDLTTEQKTSLFSLYCSPVEFIHFVQFMTNGVRIGLKLMTGELDCECEPKIQEEKENAPFMQVFGAITC